MKKKKIIYSWIQNDPWNKTVKVTNVLFILLAMSMISFAADGYSVSNTNPESVFQQQKSVTGTVNDNAGQPLPGVTVVLKGTTQGTITDIDGNFQILNIKAGDVLVFSFVGMVSQEITVGSQTVINVTMAADAIGLDEVVAIGYGAVRKSDLTGAVSTVDAKALERNPVARVDQALQGRAAGVQITQTSGAPGAGTVIRVRGGNSIQGTNEPLWVIDGIIVGQDFNLNNLNANDIKSIEILKDASSIAIYGSRGANGVVLVNTKSGGATGGKPQINLGVYAGTQLVPERPKYLSQVQQIAYTNEDALFRSASVPFPNDPSTYPDNDWFHLLLDPSPIYNADLSIAGSSENGNVKYYTSLNYFEQDGLIKSTGIEKYIFRSNLDIKLSEKLSAGFRLNYSRIHQDNGSFGYTNLIGGILPTQPIYNEDGTYNGFNEVIGSPFSNPVAKAALNTNETYTNNFLTTAYLEFRPTEKWVIRSTFSPEINNTKTNVFNSSQQPDLLEVGDTGSAEVRALSSMGWNNENTAQYQTDLGENHRITALAGASFQKFSAESVFAEAYGITSDATKFNNLALGSDPTRNIIGSDYDAFQIVSFFGRLNYSYKDKYLLTLVGRSDGSSRFAPGNKFEFYPSIAGAWRVSEEEFMQDVNFVDNLKLRASYGRSGSQGIDSYRTLALMTAASTTFGGSQNPGVTLGRPANPALKWETTNQLDLAVEATFFGGRIFTELNYYRKETNDLLLEVVVPRQTGFTGQLQNIGSLENKGWEFIMKTINVSNKDFSWKSTLTLSANKNKVLDLGGQEYIDVVVDEILGSGNTRIIVGEPTPVFTGVRYLGTWKSQDEIDASGLNPASQVVGGPRFEDKNKDGIISTEDYVVLGSPQADLVFGFDNSITYKNFDLNFFFQGTLGNEVYNLRSQNSLLTRGEAPKYIDLANRWTPDNPTSDIPRAGADAVTQIVSNSLFVEDGSHLRLKTVRLNYNLPVRKLGWSGVERMSVYASGTNLFLKSKFRLIDPETSKYGKDGVGNIAQGFSSGEYPAAKVLTLGVNVTF
ncbi:MULTISPECIES: SusC/RagA family TonB-linked outer membrane protein [unclassified Saccharicrinis]|uniref:SusC/RagA family TonB-linked outer membrane protein n=1 Tax=unclassified Saccharicrinis TaxID=2646859 RepID=UPI003D347E4B